MLAYFAGAAIDDAERAVRAGSSWSRRSCWNRMRTSSRARVGIATGRAVVGDLIGEGLARRGGGGDVELAARCALAAPSSGDQSGDAAAGRRPVRARRPRPAETSSPRRCQRGRSKAKAAPKAASRRCMASISRPSRPQTRTRHPVGAVGVGEARRRSSGPISGEPGIGKSRIVRVFRERLAEEPHVALNYFSSPTAPVAPVCRDQQRTHRPFRPRGTPETRLPSWRICSPTRRQV